MNVDENRHGRIALQPETDREAAIVGDLHAGVARADHDDLLSWFTLEVPEYPNLDHAVDAGELGEKALVIAWGEA